MIEISDTIVLGEQEVRLEFVRSSGRGGQNVNKVATAVQLRFDVGRSPALPEDVRARLVRLAGRRMTAEGVLIIQARRFRTQERNRQDALERLVDLIRRAAAAPKVRRATAPPPVARARRIAAKRRRGVAKRLRQAVSEGEE